MNKVTLSTDGLSLIKEFCKANDLKLPAVFNPTLDDPDKRMARYYHVGSCAFYRDNKIYLMVDKCASPGYGGRAWSWPAYIIDRTPYGVYAHELGHYLDDLNGWKLGVKIKSQAKEDKLTNYCPNVSEWFAEMFRLYVTNSDLLAKYRPATHEALLRVVKPVVTLPWEQVLAEAPSRTIEMAKKKVERGF